MDTRDDEEKRPGGDEPHVPLLPHMSQARRTSRVTRVKSRRERRLDVAAVVLVMLLVLAVVAFLTLFLTPVITPIVAQDLATTPTTSSWLTTQEVALTPTSADWYTLKVSGGGFQVDIPGVIGSSHAYFINDFSGYGSDYYYTNDPISSALQQREAKIWVKILYSTKITDENICPQGGTEVTLGSGKVHIPAWQRNEGRIVAVNLVLNGNAIEIDLDTRDNAQPALPTYADIWQHMLVSFAPLPTTPGQTHAATHPCS